MFIRCLGASAAAAGNYKASPDGFVSICGDNGEITHARRFKQQLCDYSLIEHLEALRFPKRDLSLERAPEFINRKAELRLLLQIHTRGELNGAESSH